jgi:uncharacterized protein (TIGR03437 family)
VNLATRQVPLPTALGESCLTVNGLAVPVIFVSPAQINGQLPFQAEGNVTVVLRTPGGVSDNFHISVLPAAPSVFRTLTGEQSVPAVVHSDGSLAGPENPLRRGEAITIYLTGLGKTNPPVEAGAPAPSDPPAQAIIAPVVTLGGAEMPVEFAGLAPGEVGVYQITGRVPGASAVGDEQTLTIKQASSSTSVAVKVVQ